MRIRKEKKRSQLAGMIFEALKEKESNIIGGIKAEEKCKGFG